MSPFSPEFFGLVVIPLLIFVARICDVTLGTMRIIFISRGMKYIAPILGFFEILIWLCAIGQVFQNLTSISHYLAYAGGFAAGNYVGIFIEEKIAIGLALVRIITQRDATNLIGYLKAEGYGVTIIDAQGKQGPGKVIFTVIKRRDLHQIIDAIHEYNPKAFYSVEDVRHAEEATFPVIKPRPQHHGFLRNLGKGK